MSHTEATKQLAREWYRTGLPCTTVAALIADETGVRVNPKSVWQWISDAGLARGRGAHFARHNWRAIIRAVHETDTPYRDIAAAFGIPLGSLRTGLSTRRAGRRLHRQCGARQEAC